MKFAEADNTDSWNDQNIVLPRQLYLAWAYEALGENATSRRLYSDLRAQTQAALLQRPDDADLRLAHGFTNAGLGAKQEAVHEGRQATALVPYSKDA